MTLPEWTPWQGRLGGFVFRFGFLHDDDAGVLDILHELRCDLRRFLLFHGPHEHARVRVNGVNDVRRFGGADRADPP